jgi:hypothetical protein
MRPASPRVAAPVQKTSPRTISEASMSTSPRQLHAVEGPPRTDRTVAAMHKVLIAISDRRA